MLAELDLAFGERLGGVDFGACAAAEAADALVSSLKKNGIAEKDIQTTGLSIQPNYDYSKSTPRLTGYTVTNTVAYNWAGFFQPVDNLPTINTVNAGQAIPVKFSLGGNYGLNIFATGYPASQNVSCGSGGSGGSDAIEETVTAGNSSLQYEPGTQRYIYVWKTDKAWSGTCRLLIVKLIDGTEHTAFFQFNGNGGGRSASENEGEEGVVQQIFLPLVNR